MTKTRFTAADVRAMVRDLRSSVLGLRVANVYSLQDQKVSLDGGTVVMLRPSLSQRAEGPAMTRVSCCGRQCNGCRWIGCRKARS